MTDKLLVPPFSKKEIEEIARKACFNFVDLTPLGAFELGKITEFNSAETPAVLDIVKKLVNDYSSDKITVLRLNCLDEENGTIIEVNASDTSVFMRMEDFKVIQVIASNVLKGSLVNESQEDEGVFAQAGFIYGIVDGEEVAQISVSLLNYEPEGIE